MGDTFVPENKHEYGFSRTLYDAVCSECKYGLEWEAQFDADGTRYTAKCCDKRYSFYSTKVIVEIEPANA